MEAAEYATMEAVEERHWWYLGLQDLVIGLVRAEAERAGRPLEILDAGCGTGRLAQLLARFGTISACDVHPLALEGARRRGLQHVFHTDLSDERGLGQERYDVVTCMDVLYHRLIHNDLAAVRNMHTALRKGGLLLLQVPAFGVLQGRHDEVVHTRHRYRRHEVIERLVAAGFDAPRVTYRLFPLFLPTLLWRRLLGPILKGKESRSDVSGIPPRWLNSLLTTYVKTENRWLQRGGALPFGTSLFAMARK
jgi:SAM-dependent methyltransferase